MGTWTNTYHIDTVIIVGDTDGDLGSEIQRAIEEDDEIAVHADAE